MCSPDAEGNEVNKTTGNIEKYELNIFLADSCIIFFCPVLKNSSVVQSIFNNLFIIIMRLFWGNHNISVVSQWILQIKKYILPDLTFSENENIFI